MRIYAFYMQPGRTALADAVAVREGFSWGALCFGFLWALYRRLWREAALMAGLPALVAWMALSGPHSTALALALAALLAAFNACCANEWRCAALERRGHVLAGVAVGATRADAERRFFERAAARFVPPPLSPPPLPS